jgi:hypothetical protein
MSNQKKWYLNIHPETLEVVGATQFKSELTVTAWPEVEVAEEIAMEWLTGCCGFNYQAYRTGTTYCVGPKISKHKRIRPIQTEDQPFVQYTIWYQEGQMWCESIDSIMVYAVASDNELIIQDKILVEPFRQHWAQPDNTTLYCDYGHVFARLRI